MQSKIGLAIVLLLASSLAGCVSSDQNTPEGTVRATIDAWASLDVDRIVSLVIDEDRGTATAYYETIFSNVKSASYSNLQIKTTYKDENSATVVADYDASMVLSNGRVDKHHSTKKFYLEKRYGRWLVSSVS